MIRHTFPVSEQRAASHCDALVKPSAPVADLVPQFEQLGARITRPLARAIAQAWGDPAIEARLVAIRQIDGAQLAGACSELSVASLHQFGRGNHTLMLAIDGRALLEQLDRTFGGLGQIGKVLPAKLPSSADLIARRLEPQITGTLGAALGGVDMVAGARDTNLDTLAPFTADARLITLEIEVFSAERQPMPLLMALQVAALAEMFPRAAGHAAANRRGRKPQITDRQFADLPLNASARLVDMNIPLSRLIGLKAGSVLPIMVARSIPLRIGKIVVAQGTVGEIDNQVALQVTEIFSGKDTSND